MDKLGNWSAGSLVTQYQTSCTF